MEALYLVTALIILGALLFGMSAALSSSGSSPPQRVATVVKHSYDKCGTCDSCQADYIKKQMDIAQEELRLHEKRLFEQRVADEMKAFREKHGLNVPKPKDWKAEADMWKERYERATHARWGNY